RGGIAMSRRGLRRGLSVVEPESSAGTFEELEHDEPWPGVERSSFSSGKATVTRYEFKARAEFPLHSHPQEQITLIEEGEVELTVRDEVRRLGPGGWSVIAPGVPHGIRAGDEGARFLAIVVPKRDTPHAYTVVDGASA
ncbi:MAG: cupin domain-containing protein, partial [Myxococcaceae bacterium]